MVKNSTLTGKTSHSI